jgi:hypothetical protein
MHSPTRFTPAALLTLLLAGCQDLALSVVCEADPPPAVAVSLFDGSGTRNVVSEAWGWYTVGERRDSLLHRVHPAGEVLAAYGPAGRYRLEIHRPGGETILIPGVEVPPGECGPRTVRLSTTLEERPATTEDRH